MWTVEAARACLVRRAPRQHDPELGPTQEHAMSGEYNLWYGKSSSAREHGRPVQKEAATRCNARTDSGRTKGDEAKQRTWCLHFARGNCDKGYACMFLHRLPTGVDDANLDMLHDVFGREKHRDDREDNGGTGSYMRMCRTLFIYYGGAAEWGGQRLKELLARAFGEWGPIEDIHVVPSKCIGFVRYKFRASAEFAKEAMMGQKLRGGGKEALVVRWANDDPNPVAVKRVKREREDTVIDALHRAEARMPPEQRLAMQQMRLLQRAREGMGGRETRGAGGGSEDEDEEEGGVIDPLAYPDTDAQYPDAGEVPGLPRRLPDEGTDGGEIGREEEQEKEREIGGGGGGGGGRTADPEAGDAEWSRREEWMVDVGSHIHPQVSGEEAGRIAAAIGLGPEAAALGAQQAAYQAYIAAGGDPASWDPAEFAGVLGGTGRAPGALVTAEARKGSGDARDYDVGGPSVAAVGGDLGDDELEFDEEDYPVFEVEEVEPGDRW